MISKEYVYVRGGCTFPWIPVIVYMPFGSSGRRCITTLSRSKRRVGLGWLVGRHNRPVGKASKAWLSDGRRRPGFRRLCTCPLDPLGVVASMRNHGRKVGWVVGPHNRPVTIAAEKQAKLGFPTAAGDRDKAETILWWRF